MHVRGPATLLPSPWARLIGFALLAALGALEWRRMAEATSDERALLWVLAACAVGALVIAAPRWRWPLAAAGLALAVVVSGLDLSLLRASRWPELGEGLARGAEALGGARLPYRGADAWPAATLELSGAVLVMVAALMACWPGRGGRLGALILLMTLVISPVAALAGPQPSLMLGAALAALTAVYLFLERMPVRPGMGLAVLAAAALAAALPLGLAADREEPWFDYRSFAEGLGPVDPITFDWEHGYGPIDWPREHRELFRVRADEPFYWKTEVLEEFDGERWRIRRGAGGLDGRDGELADGWQDRRGWIEDVQITLRRLRTKTLVAPGTILDVSEASRGVAAEPGSGRWLAARELGRGDSYTVRAHVPRPATEQLARTTAGFDGDKPHALRLRLPFRPGALAGGPELPSPGPDFAPRYVRDADIEFSPFQQPADEPRAHYTAVGRYGDGRAALERTAYRRTWRLAQRLREDSHTAYDYVLRVNAFLRSKRFRYTERPQPVPGAPPLEAFLFETAEGYCQHFSGAMALLLRMGGVPARVATGFSPGGFRKRRGEWVIRDIDAHSWVEAWFDDVGWVTFDPTPAGTPARSQVAAIDTPEYADTADLAPPPAAREEDPAARRPEGIRGETARPSTATPGATGDGAGGDGGGLPLGLLAALAATAALAGGGAFALRRRGQSPRSASVGDVDRAVAEVRRAMERAGRPVPAAVTLAQLEKRLGGSSYLASLRRARFSPRPVLPSGADRRDFRRALAAGLGWRGTLRAWWALPPRRPR